MSGGRSWALCDRGTGAQQGFDDGQVLGPGDLGVGAVRVVAVDRRAERFDEGGIVGGVRVGGGVGALGGG